MLKEEYKDAHKDYDKSLTSHMNEDYDAMKEHECSIAHHDYDDGDDDDDFNCGSIGHFGE